MAVSSAKSAAVVLGALACGWVAVNRWLLKSRPAIYCHNRRYSKSHLCICFVDYGGGDKSARFRVRSVSLSSLFGSAESEHDCKVFKDVKSWECPSQCAFRGIGLLPTKYGTLYAASRITTEADGMLTRPDAKPLSMHKYDIICNAESVQICHVESTPDMPSSWSQSHPLLVEIQGLIYVLSRYQKDQKDEGHSATFFQVYNPKDDTWKSLPCPPCVVDRSPLSYVVVDNNKLCISTLYFSSAFDIITKEWAPCNLYDDWIDHEGVYEEGLTWREYVNPDESERKIMGPPLPFTDQALVIHEKFLLCVHWVTGELVAFKMNPVDGKISSFPQSLVTQEKLGNRDFESVGLVDLGNGYICLVGCEYHFDGNLPAGVNKIKIFKFKLYIAEDGEELIFDEAEFQISTINLTGHIRREPMHSVFAC